MDRDPGVGRWGGTIPDVTVSPKPVYFKSYFKGFASVTTGMILH